MNHQFFTLVWACFIVISPEANFAEKVSRTKAATAHFTDSIELVRSRTKWVSRQAASSLHYLSLLQLHIFGFIFREIRHGAFWGWGKVVLKLELSRKRWKSSPRMTCSPPHWSLSASSVAYFLTYSATFFLYSSGLQIHVEMQTVCRLCSVLVHLWRYIAAASPLRGSVGFG